MEDGNSCCIFISFPSRLRRKPFKDYPVVEHVVIVKDRVVPQSVLTNDALLVCILELSVLRGGFLAGQGRTGDKLALSELAHAKRLFSPKAWSISMLLYPMANYAPMNFHLDDDTETHRFHVDFPMALLPVPSPPN